MRDIIDASKPVCVRIGWNGGGGHFVAIAGYRVSHSGAQLVDVEDPLYGPSIAIYDEFKGSYLSRGEWFLRGVADFISVVPHAKPTELQVYDIGLQDIAAPRGESEMPGWWRGDS